MAISKPWNWKEEKDRIWICHPCEESYFLAARWEKQGYEELLDFGCGLGRHSIFFAQQGFNVSSFDLSLYGTNHLKEWAERENLNIDIKLADMLELPYSDSTFDCIFAYHVISHTDSLGMKKVINEIKRVIKPLGELYLTLCSKDSWRYHEIEYPRIDENTIIKTDDGPEKGIPHFYVNLEDVIDLFCNVNLQLLSIRHIDDCYYDGGKRNGIHYFILARNI